MHGFLNIDKPAGITSHDVVARARRIAGQRRVGHAGTLDPAATGVLVVALGGATRLIEYVQDQTTKRYTAVVRLGVTTETDDAEGLVVETQPVPTRDQTQIEAILASFCGEIHQVPPMYSALHHRGRRLYELARAGVTVDVPARPVVIYELTLIDWTPPLLTLDVLCGKGTYIRSLARDIGAAIRCGAHLQSLQRTAVGSFRIEDATPFDRLDLGVGELLLPPDTAVVDWPEVRLSTDDARRVRNGQTLQLAYNDGDRLRAYTPDGTFLALLRRDDGFWKPEKVFDWS